MFQFCGSTGVDLMEPLTCRGRRGSGGNREPDRLYRRAARAASGIGRSTAYWYRTWGRTAYNPDTAATVFQREFGPGAAARALDASLAHASRILPIVTTAYLPSAACDAYWPEIYWNQPIVLGGAGEDRANARPDPYTDTPAPRTFQNASPLDPQMFSRMSDAADELIAGRRSGKYSPIEVAAWLERAAKDATDSLARAGTNVSVDWRRTAIDVEILAGLGRFFAAKIRSGVLYAIHERTGDRRALEEALRLYAVARAAWAGLSHRAESVYADDLSVSDRPTERGAWADRLVAIDQDIARMEQQGLTAKPSADPRVRAAVAAVLTPSKRTEVACTHTPPQGFRPGTSVSIDLALAAPHPSIAARLYYRHVNQAERFENVAMIPDGARYRAEIPGAYTDSAYPLQYYVEFTNSADPMNGAWIYPGFRPDLTGLPYVVLRRV